MSLPFSLSSICSPAQTSNQKWTFDHLLFCLPIFILPLANPRLIFWHLSHSAAWLGWGMADKTPRDKNDKLFGKLTLWPSFTCSISQPLLGLNMHRILYHPVIQIRINNLLLPLLRERWFLTSEFHGRITVKFLKISRQQE